MDLPHWWPWRRPQPDPLDRTGPASIYLPQPDPHACTGCDTCRPPDLLAEARAIVPGNSGPGWSTLRIPPYNAGLWPAPEHLGAAGKPLGPDEPGPVR